MAAGSERRASADLRRTCPAHMTAPLSVAPVCGPSEPRCTTPAACTPCMMPFEIEDGVIARGARMPPAICPVGTTMLGGGDRPLIAQSPPKERCGAGATAEPPAPGPLT
mmetsp:Transcript_84479/g.243904  ORF Transcript_84479/g.243904 Transcript_84479/m.243904 type:complete len:109 (-) Transcript_84479:162-488(-)